MSRRRGTVMVYLAVILPVLFGALALVMDFGLGAVTQRTMQTAADNAAVEGLLIRDQGFSQVVQREHVRQTMRQQFDDDLDPDNGDELNLGAGKILPVTTPGRTTLNGSETVAYGNILPYDPDPQLNLANLAQGDMISGYYLHSDRHDEGYQANAYDRDDFVPTGNAAPLNSTDAFLVRLRRTPAQAAGGADNTAGVSSAGGPVAALFTRGTMTKGLDPGQGDSIRTDGLTVRATSIASAEKTTTVGPMVPNALTGSTGDIEGYYPFTLDLAEWNNLTAGVPGAYELLSTGHLVPVGSLTPVGHVFRVTHHRASPMGENLTAIGSADTVIPVYHDAGFTDTELTLPFMIRIDNEIMLVTGRSGAEPGFENLDWTVVRGYAGSTPATHSSAALIQLHEPTVIGDHAALSPRPLQPGSGQPPEFFNINVWSQRPGTGGTSEPKSYIEVGFFDYPDPDAYIEQINITIPSQPNPQSDTPAADEGWDFTEPGNTDKPGYVDTADWTEGIGGGDVTFNPNGGTPDTLEVKFKTSPANKRFVSGESIVFGGGVSSGYVDAEDWAYSPVNVFIRIINGDGSITIYSFGFVNDPDDLIDNYSVVGPDDSRDTQILFAEGSRVYIPLYDDQVPTNGDPARIVGFGVALLEHVIGDGPHRVNITKLPAVVAPRNASANFGSGFNRMGAPAMTQAQITSLFDIRRAFNDQPLRSPASVRAMSR